MLNRKTFLGFVFLLITATAVAQPRQGQMADDIALPTTAGDTLHLSSLKGKVVLLDFWASWCGPCRVTNKGLGKLYAKFKDKGFEIFSVSFDKDKEDWIKAIKKDKINWLQVNDNGGWDAITAYNWRVEVIPTSYLIDKEGRLIAMDLQGKDLEKALKDMLEN